jgi:hypothetical protein
LIEAVDRGGFAGPVLPEQRENFARCNIQVQAVERYLLSVRFGKFTRCQHGLDQVKLKDQFRSDGGSFFW